MVTSLYFIFGVSLLYLINGRCLKKNSSVGFYFGGMTLNVYLTDGDEHILHSSSTRETVHLPTEEGQLSGDTFKSLINTFFVRSYCLKFKSRVRNYAFLVASGWLTMLFHATIPVITQTIALIFSQTDQNKIQSRPPIGHFLFTFPLLWKYKTDFLLL